MNEKDTHRLGWLNSELFEMENQINGMAKRKLTLEAERDLIWRVEELKIWDIKEGLRRNG